jgi:nucleotidyltransferase substrate binding protein (TIGR01987 family)
MKKVIPLDLSSLQKAAYSLEEAVNEHKKQQDNLFVRDATIQRFEYTYELTYKMLKRFLEMTEASSEEIAQMSFATLIRTGAEKGLLQSSWDVWSSYRTARNLTSYTYDEAKAVEVCAIIPGFLFEAKYLIEQLDKKLMLLN